jgi:polysaccharide transporter, PST family
LIKDFFLHRVVKNIGALLILQVANYLFPLVALLHLARVLDIEVFGVVAFSIAIVQTSSIATGFGFDLSASQRIAKLKSREKSISRIISAIFAFKLVILLTIFAALTCFAMTTTKYSEFYQLFLLSFLPIFGLCFQSNWFFIGLERMFYITTYTVVAKALYLALILTFVNSGEDYLYVPIINGVAQLVASTLGICFIFRLGYRLHFPRLKDIRYVFSFSRELFLARVSVAAYSQGGILILGAIAAPSVTAAYSLAQSLYKAMQSTFSAVVLSLYPFMTIEKDLLLYFKAAFACFCLVCVGASIGFTLVPVFLPKLLGSEWTTSIEVLNVFFIAIVVHSLASMAGYPLAVAVNRVDVANKSAVMGALFYVIVCCYFVFTSEVDAILMASIMCLAELYVFLHRVVCLRRGITFAWIDQKKNN